MTYRMFIRFLSGINAQKPFPKIKMANHTMHIAAWETYLIATKSLDLEMTGCEVTLIWD